MKKITVYVLSAKSNHFMMFDRTVHTDMRAAFEAGIKFTGRLYDEYRIEAARFLEGSRRMEVGRTHEFGGPTGAFHLASATMQVPE
jgi:hypothetical protein